MGDISVREPEVLTAVKLSMLIFWVITPCGLDTDSSVSKDTLSPSSWLKA
jgi:hypothetical protein